MNRRREGWPGLELLYNLHRDRDPAGSSWVPIAILLNEV